jgi:Protein of unknown function (DUF2948)
LHLLGQDEGDLPALSALLQDATLRAVDAAWDRRSRRFVALVNRYRWEAVEPSRVRAALRIETVTAVQRQLWPGEDSAVLGLLSLAAGDSGLVLTCSGGTALRFAVEVIEIVLEDVAAAWPTARIPRHTT